MLRTLCQRVPSHQRPRWCPGWPAKCSAQRKAPSTSWTVISWYSLLQHIVEAYCWILRNTLFNCIPEKRRFSVGPVKFLHWAVVAVHLWILSPSTVRKEIQSTVLQDEAELGLLGLPVDMLQWKYQYNGILPLYMEIIERGGSRPNKTQIHFTWTAAYSVAVKCEKKILTKHLLVIMTLYVIKVIRC